jgi:LysR family transcriptional regulator, glycine cleavage system transcriptional activator
VTRWPYNLPTLTGLTAFEAAGRHLSLTIAAQELNVTAGALSKTIKQLEGETGTSLFVRRHRALELTRAGATLHAALVEAFERLHTAVETISETRKIKTVTIGSTNAFAQFWLMPRLAQFWREHRDIVVDHIISDRTHDNWHKTVDLRVHYGSGQAHETHNSLLFHDTILAVASPHFSAQKNLNSIASLEPQPLLEVESADPSWTTWNEFFRNAGLRTRKLATRRFNSHVIAVQAALDGQGIVLGWKRLIQPLLHSKKLIAVGGHEMLAPHSFYLTWNNRRPLNDECEVLRDWLLSNND